MENFRVTLDFSMVVSEGAADELDYLVSEFVQSILNAVVNDEYDQIASTIANTIPPYVDITKLSPEDAKLGGLLFVPDEGSDAPTEGYGSTDFDRR